MKERRFSHLDFYFALVLLVFSVGMIVESQRMPMMGQVYVSPGLMPTVVGIVLLVQALIILAGSIKPFLARRKNPQGQERSFEISRDLVVTILLLASYIFLLLRFFPYFYATFVFLALAMWYFKAGPVWKIGIVSLVASGAITYLFGSIFLIPLP